MKSKDLRSICILFRDPKDRKELEISNIVFDPGKVVNLNFEGKEEEEESKKEEEGTARRTTTTDEI